MPPRVQRVTLVAQPRMLPAPLRTRLATPPAPPRTLQAMRRRQLRALPATLPKPRRARAAVLPRRRQAQAAALLVQPKAKLRQKPILTRALAREPAKGPRQARALDRNCRKPLRLFPCSDLWA